MEGVTHVVFVGGQSNLLLSAKEGVRWCWRMLDCIPSNLPRKCYFIVPYFLIIFAITQENEKF